MLEKQFFDGSITCVSQSSAPSRTKAKRSSKQKLLKYSYPGTLTDAIGETLIHKFGQLSFTQKEKRKLSREVRKLIYAIQNFDYQYIEKEAKSLCQELKKKKSFTIFVEAKGLGAFICLAAAVSGQLPKNKEITFKLCDVPFALLPKKLIKKTEGALPMSIRLQFAPTNNCWFEDFQTLKKCPNNCALDRIVEDEMINESIAA